MQTTPTLISPLIHYDVRIQQWATSNNYKVDFISTAQLELYPKWLAPLFSKVKQGKVKVYASPEAEQALSLEEVNDIMFKTDTMLITNPVTFEDEAKNNNNRNCC